jgi:phosphoribosyl-ATP pyrophosphohydrolase/phosphoribosyl-AMP cyclohydrolase
VIDIASVKFDTNGLVPAIVQDSLSLKVLMLGYMSKESLELTVATGQVTFWSRSRNEIWVKGATSGNFLNLVSLALDCDSDAILVSAVPVGPTCHTGSDSCFDSGDN